MTDADVKRGADHWEQVWSEKVPFKLNRKKALRRMTKSDRAYIKRIGVVEGLQVLDLGCGKGLLSVMFALEGAYVTAVDLSESAVAATKALAERNGVEQRVQVEQADLRELKQLDRQFDLVVGRFVLHHIEPFEDFASQLGALLKPEGRALFLENSANNRLLIFFRRHLVGRYGVPRLGDEREQPFCKAELDLVRKYFKKVRVSYPEFLFFGLVAPYLLKGNKRVARLAGRLDSWCFRNIKGLRPYSYRQIIEAGKPKKIKSKGSVDK